MESFNGKLSNLSRASGGSYEKHSLRQTLLKLKSKVGPFKCKSKVPATVREVFCQAKKIIFCKVSRFFSNLTTMLEHVKERFCSSNTNN